MKTYSSPPQIANLILFNGKLWTGNPHNPIAEAVAVSGDMIIGVGSTDEIMKFANSSTHAIDVDGRLILPGFIDCHTHFMQGGRELLSIDLRDAPTEEEFALRIKEYTEQCPPGQWITGGNWDHTLWLNGQLPHRKWIDRYTPKNPVFIARVDHHAGLANSLALELAGITRNTADPEGGLIARDEDTGEPTGILKESAMGLVREVIPRPTAEDNKRALRAALDNAARCGVTSLQDCAGWDELDIYRTALASGELTVRVYLLTPLSDWQKQTEYIAEHGRGDKWLRLGGVKGFADGSLGARTARFWEPYADAPDTRGLWTTAMSSGKMESLALAADAAGLQLSVHAIGDEANHAMLDIYEKVIEKNGKRDRRLQIEHAQHVHPVDFERFSKLNVIASVQPYHIIDDGRWAEQAIGHKRCETTYAFQMFLEHDVKLAFGSDWPVAPLDPLLGIYAAVTRQTLDGKNIDGWFPEHKITVEEAVRAYTVDAAYAAFEEDIKGAIEVGKLADFVVLSEDIFAIEPADIRNVKVILTVVGGEICYSQGVGNDS